MVDILDQAVDKTNKVYRVVHLDRSGEILNGEVPGAGTSEVKTDLSTDTAESILNSNIFHSTLR